MQVTKNIAEETYSDFKVSGGRDLSGISDAVYSIPKDGSLTISTPFQNAADFSSSFTDSASIKGYSALKENTNSVEDFKAIILTDDAFVTDYIATPMIQANGHALVVAHNASDKQAEMFESYSDVSDAYVAGTANGARISSGTIDISTLNNNKFFGTVIKSGVESGDFLGFTDNSTSTDNSSADSSTSIVNYMAIVNDGGNDFRGIKLSCEQTLKGVIIAADAETNTEGGDIDISGSTAQNVIVKAGDGANGRYSGYTIKSFSGDSALNPDVEYSYNDMDSNFAFDNSGDETNAGNIDVENGIQSVDAILGKSGGFVSTNTAENSPRTFGLEDRSNKFHSDISYGHGDWTTNKIMLRFRIASGYFGMNVQLANGRICGPVSLLYVVFGQYADDHTSEDYTESSIWKGAGRGDFDDNNYNNAKYLKYLFVTIMYDETDAGELSVRDDSNTEGNETASSSIILQSRKDYYQVYPEPQGV